MTRHGDHGGDSDNELDSALFVYSPGRELSTKVVINIVTNFVIIPIIYNCFILLTTLTRI